MRIFCRLSCLLLSLFGIVSLGEVHAQKADTEKTRQNITLATYPSLSPDGKRTAFAWGGDIWISKIRGRATRLTFDSGEENGPVFSPDGKQIAFTSTRNGGKEQVFVVSVGGGIPRQVTFHGEGSRVLGWYPEGKSILVSGMRDFATRSPVRFFRVELESRKPESLLFDAEGMEASLSPDGKKLLFTREGYELYRQGYRGTKASQIWMAENLETDKPKFTKLLASESGARSPKWKADGSGFYFTGNQGEDEQFNLWEYQFEKKRSKQLTHFKDDAVILPGLSGDGGTLIFRKEFEFYRIDFDADPKPRKVGFWAADDGIKDDEVRRTLSKATNLSFSKDGLEIAFVSGGDVWVMDTVLKEPRQVTSTPFEETEPVFAPDGKSIYFIREQVDSIDVWAAKRADEKEYWWRNDSFKADRISKDGAQKHNLLFVPGGKRISYVRGQGELVSSDPDGENLKSHVKSWNVPDYDWSPDGKWLTYSVSDNDFNRDVWIKPIDDHRKPFNLSRHPDNDTSPRWSPDGKMIAFTGRRFEDETDIYYVYLTKKPEEEDKREKTLKSAIEKMKKERKPPAPPEKKAPAAPAEKPAEPTKKPSEPAKKAEPVKKPEPAKPEPGAAAKPPVKKAEPKPASPKKEPAPKSKPSSPKPATPTAASIEFATVDGEDPSTPAKAEPASNPKPKAAAPAPAKEAAKKEEPEKKSNELEIDFDTLYERIRRVTIKNSDESGLFWSHDSKRLAFRGEVKGVKGTYQIAFPDKLSPTLLNAKAGALPRWDAKNDTIYWLVDGLPSTLSKGKLTTYSFRAKQKYDRGDYRLAAFHQIWRVMRDNWYDENLNNNDWTAIRKKYENAAAGAVSNRDFDRVAAMLLGELNGSHLGFRSSTSSSSFMRSGSAWTDSTAHLGVKFDRQFKGPGLKISSVIPRSIADQSDIDLSDGDIVLSIDGQKVSIQTDLTLVLNGTSDRDIELELKGKPAEKGGKIENRTVTLRPTSYSTARILLKQEQLVKNREMVEKISKGRLGYVYVPRMQWNEFIKFEEEIFARGAGKDGLVIDVRDNGGGFTADHLLTVLNPIEHAITVPRGGGTGYPQDRRVYGVWSKPIIVLCNQNSFSNAEIFAHAVKDLKRGKLVGVTTAGGVISTGATGIMDVGTLRLPFRGWYKKSDGEDMELNGAVPDFIVWPEPGDAAAGKDRQIEKAVAELLKEVEAGKKKPAQKLIPRSQDK